MSNISNSERYVCNGKQFEQMPPSIEQIINPRNLEFQLKDSTMNIKNEGINIIDQCEKNGFELNYDLNHADSDNLKEIKEPDFESNKKQKLFESIEMELRGHDEEVILSYLKFLQMVIDNLQLQTSQVCVIPYHLYRRTVLKSPSIHKKARVQYEQRTYRRSITFYRLTENNANVLLTYLQYNLPEGVAMLLNYKYIEPLPDFLS